jgi:DNA-binding transcriptional MocR family regulator
MDDAGLVPDALDAACRAAARASGGGRPPRALFCVPTAHNPTGTVTPPARRDELAVVLRRHALPVIEDDVYAPLLGAAPAALASYVPELTWYVSGVSKVLAPGLRVGYLVPPSAEATRAAIATLRTSMWMASPLDSAVVTRWIVDGTAADVTRALRDEAARRHRLAERVLGARLQPGAPAWHCWMHATTDRSPARIVAEARRLGVGITPGDVFLPTADATSAPSGVRIALGGVASSVALRRALMVLRDLVPAPETAPAPPWGAQDSDSA